MVSFRRKKTEKKSNENSSEKEDPTVSPTASNGHAPVTEAEDSAPAPMKEEPAAVQEEKVSKNFFRMSNFHSVNRTVS